MLREKLTARFCDICCAGVPAGRCNPLGLLCRGRVWWRWCWSPCACALHSLFFVFHLESSFTSCRLYSQGSVSTETGGLIEGTAKRLAAEQSRNECMTKMLMREDGMKRIQRLASSCSNDGQQQRRRKRTKWCSNRSGRQRRIHAPEGGEPSERGEGKQAQCPRRSTEPTSDVLGDR